MHDAAKNASLEDAKAIARQCALRRAERLDMMVAATLLVLLIFGWAVRLVPFDQWPRGDFHIAFNARQT